MPKKATLGVGDHCRIVGTNGKLGPTVWEITAVGTQGACLIKEAGTQYAEQSFVLSLLQKVAKGNAPKDITEDVLKTLRG